MKLLIDTHVLIWASALTAAAQPQRISPETARLLDDPANDLYFSPVAVWEVAIKNTLKRFRFQVDPHLFRTALLDNGYVELPITSQHAAAVAGLPPIHRDPFDRILAAQAIFEGMTLLTADEVLQRYPVAVRRA